MKTQKLFVISLGGSIVVPAPGQIDVLFLKKFRVLILKFLKKGYKFAIVVGGGKTSRLYQSSASKITPLPYDDQDWLGIHATRLNAQLLRTIFKKEACPVVLDDPFKKVKNFLKYKIIIASGWRPGNSTDYIAVLLAKRFGSKEIINLSNIQYGYDLPAQAGKDFKKYKNAKPFKNISWANYLKISGKKWIPGLSKPFDPVASRLAKELDKIVVVAKGTDLKNLQNIFEGKKIKGTIIADF